METWLEGCIQILQNNLMTQNTGRKIHSLYFRCLHTKMKAETDSKRELGENLRQWKGVLVRKCEQKTFRGVHLKRVFFKKSLSLPLLPSTSLVCLSLSYPSLCSVSLPLLLSDFVSSRPGSFTLSVSVTLSYPLRCLSLRLVALIWPSRLTGR